jgi:hypothetical protein
MTPFGKSSKINHIVSRGVACRPLVSPGKWKVEWKIQCVGPDAVVDGHPSRNPGSLTRVSVRQLSSAPSSIH